MTTARQLGNLKQHRGRSPEELERIARRIRMGTEDRDLRRLFSLAELGVWLDEYRAGRLPRSALLQFVEEGTDRLVKRGLRMLEGMTPSRRDRFLDALITDENARIERFEQIGAGRESIRPRQGLSLDITSDARPDGP